MIALSNIKDDNGNTKIVSKLNFYSIGITIIGGLCFVILSLILADRAFVFKSLELHSDAIKAMCVEMASSKSDRDHIKRNQDMIQAEIRELRQNQFIGPQQQSNGKSGRSQ